MINKPETCCDINQAPIGFPSFPLDKSPFQYSGSCQKEVIKISKMLAQSAGINRRSLWFFFIGWLVDFSFFYQLILDSMHTFCFATRQWVEMLFLPSIFRKLTDLIYFTSILFNFLIVRNGRCECCDQDEYKFIHVIHYLFF